MRVTIAAVGRPRDAALAAAIQEYEARAARYWPVRVEAVKGERAEGGLAPADVMRREGDRLLGRLADAGMIVACDPAGSGMTSEAFAAWLGERRDRAESVAFVIGGAFGLGPAVLAAAQRRLSLATWTLPHELARLVLAEQLYRAGTIVRGEPYHK